MLTGNWMAIAVIEAWTLNGRIEPLAESLRQAATRILVHAAWPEWSLTANSSAVPLYPKAYDHAA